jgi:hypothetical protein
MPLRKYKIVVTIKQSTAIATTRAISRRLSSGKLHLQLTSINILRFSFRSRLRALDISVATHSLFILASLKISSNLSYTLMASSICSWIFLPA